MSLNPKLPDNSSGRLLSDFMALSARLFGASLPLKIGLSAILGCLCLFVLLPVQNEPSETLKQILAFSPGKQAQDFYDRDGPKAAYDYAVFYEGLPGAINDPELSAIKTKAYEERSSWLYMGKELTLGFFGLKHHEDYAGIAKSAVSLIPFGGDLQSAARYGNELLQEWSNYREGKETDPLHLGLAALGVVQVVLGLVSNNDALNQIKAQTNALLNSLDYMNPQLKEVLLGKFDSVFKSLANTDLAKADSWDSLKQIIIDKRNQFVGILENAEGALGQFQSLINLDEKYKDFAPVVVAASANESELNRNAEMASKIAAINPNILLYGGEPALLAAERLQQKGDFNIKTLEAALAYGPAGLNALGALPFQELEKEVNEARNGDYGSHFRLPGFLAFLIVLAAALTITLFWLPELKRIMLKH